MKKNLPIWLFLSIILMTSCRQRFDTMPNEPKAQNVTQQFNNDNIKSSNSLNASNTSHINNDLDKDKNKDKKRKELKSSESRLKNPVSSNNSNNSINTIDSSALNSASDNSPNDNSPSDIGETVNLSNNLEETLKNPIESNNTNNFELEKESSTNLSNTSNANITEDEKESFSQKTAKQLLSIINPLVTSTEANNNVEVAKETEPKSNTKVGSISQEPLRNVEISKEFKFSGLTYKFNLKWEHWYINNKVIYQRSEDNENKTLLTIESIDMLDTNKDFKSRRDFALSILDNLDSHGITRIDKKNESQFILLGSKGYIEEGIYNYEETLGNAVIYVFTTKDKGYIITIFSTSSGIEDIRILGDKVIDSVIRGN